MEEEQLKLAFSANKGSDFGSQKSSIGENYRVLCSLLSHNYRNTKPRSSIIFDEIDMGGSEKLRNGGNHAAHGELYAGDNHYPLAASSAAVPTISKVFKENPFGQHLYSVAKPPKHTALKKSPQMLSGEVLTESVLQHAKELLNYVYLHYILNQLR